MKAETIPDQRQQLLCSLLKKKGTTFIKRIVFQYCDIQWLNCLKLSIFVGGFFSPECVFHTTGHKGHTFFIICLDELAICSNNSRCYFQINHKHLIERIFFSDDGLFVPTNNLIVWTNYILTHHIFQSLFFSTDSFFKTLHECIFVIWVEKKHHFNEN